MIEVNVKESDKVTRGKPIEVTIAMKMEIVTQAPCDGVVGKVAPIKDMKVDGNDLLLIVNC